MICQTMYILTLTFKEENADNYIENYLYFLYNEDIKKRKIEFL